MGGWKKFAAALRTSVYTLRYYHFGLRAREVAIYAGKESALLDEIARELRENPAYRGYRVTLLKGEGPRCAWHLGGANYLFACGALPDWWTKREGQVLAQLAEPPAGRSYDMGGLQRSLLCANFLLCRDEALRGAVADTYWLDGLFRGRYLLGSDAASLCARVLQGASGCPERPAAEAERSNVLLHAGTLRKNGLTTSLLNLFSELDLERRNYYLTFASRGLADDPSRLDRIPPGVRLLPLPQTHCESALEKLATQLYFHRNFQRRWVMRLVERYFARLYRRSFGDCDFAWAIDCDGYYTYGMNMLLYGRRAGRAVYVHNDMLREMETRHNQHRPTLERVYRSFERVIPVTEDIVEPTVRLSGRSDNIRVIPNCHDWRGAQRRALEPLRFDPDTSCNLSPEALSDLLEKAAIKIINIGRYSPEKGHDGLLRAFARFHKERPDSCLIVVGGHGELYERTVQLASELGCGECVALIRSLQNPMPLLKRCDLFVLSSLYEGLGLVILEADSLGVPVISTDVPGPRGFMREHGGALVPLSVDGLYRGMVDFAEGKIRAMNVDYAAYNRRAIAQFEALFEGEAPT